MDTNQPAANDTPPQLAERPPFNEVSVLFPLLTIYTVGYLALMIADFVLKGVFDLPEGIMPVYIALLGAYAADKEIRRWIGTPEPPRKGSLFVYLWLLFFLAAYIIYSFRPEYGLPNNLIPVCLQVLGIFFGSKASKYVYATRRADDRPSCARALPPTRSRFGGTSRRAGDGGATADDRGRQAEILDMIKAAGKVTNRDVAARFQVSDTSANRLLADMTAKGLIQQMGERKGTYYVLP